MPVHECEAHVEEWREPLCGVLIESERLGSGRSLLGKLAHGHSWPVALATGDLVGGLFRVDHDAEGVLTLR